MAKKNVKYIEVSAGNVTVVELNGVTYTVEIDEAVKGDLVQLIDVDTDEDYLVDGGFYEVVDVDLWDDPQIIDEVGDEFDCSGIEYRVFRAERKNSKILEDLGREPNVFKRGDIVLVKENCSGHTVGTIGVVACDTDDFNNVQVTANGRTTLEVVDLVAPVELLVRPVTH